MTGKFQTIVLVAFIFAAVFGVLVFSGAIPIGNDNSPGAQGTVVLWGTIRQTDIFSALEEFNAANPSIILQYVEKSPETFDQELLEALAEGRGPDLFFLPDNLAYHYKDKILTIPYESYPLSSYKKSFVGATEVFLNSAGVLAFPLTVDPLVMYYNRSMLDANSIAEPPVYWDELLPLIPTLTKKDESNTIQKSAVALGQFSNITHAKDILSALFMQIGNPIVTEENGVFVSALNNNSFQYNLDSVLNFYTSFADPAQSVYSWNRSFSNSSDAFSREDLAFYFGYASELRDMINKNPNQDFLVTSIPQLREANFKLTSARVTGVAVSAFSKNLQAAVTTAGLLANSNFAPSLAGTLGIVPARRDLLTPAPTNAFSPTFYGSALYARSWLDPSPKDTDNIFRTMVEGVLSNNLDPDRAIADADAKLNLLLIQ